MTQPAPEAPTQSAGPGPGDAAGVELGAGDLPAYCPNPNMPIWSAHPRVFLDVTHGAGESHRPYELAEQQYRALPRRL